MAKLEWYLEYEIQVNRPGLLGDISSLLGMLSINIVTINGVDTQRRGLLLKCRHIDQIKRLESILNTMDTIKVTKLREPKLRDRLAVRHGRYIQRDADDKKTFRFERDELGLLVDFMAELFKKRRAQADRDQGNAPRRQDGINCCFKRLCKQKVAFCFFDAAEANDQKPADCR